MKADINDEKVMEKENIVRKLEAKEIEIQTMKEIAEAEFEQFKKEKDYLEAELNRKENIIDEKELKLQSALTIVRKDEKEKLKKKTYLINLLTNI